MSGSSWSRSCWIAGAPAQDGAACHCRELMLIDHSCLPDCAQAGSAYQHLDVFAEQCILSNDSCRYTVRALVRRSGQLAAVREGRCEEAIGDVLVQETLQSACRDCDAVASCVGGRCAHPVHHPCHERWKLVTSACRMPQAARCKMITDSSMQPCFLQPHGGVQHPGVVPSHGGGQFGALSGGALRRRHPLRDAL
jgi:NAD(P)H-binding